MSKYGARKTSVNGIAFDSRKEAERYAELSLLERAGVISNLELQPAFTLLATFKHQGKTVRGVTYRADFQYIEDGQLVVEDVKGMRTKDYIIKSKWFMSLHPDVIFRET